MNSLPEWLPTLILLEDFDGNWDRYINEVFSIFYQDFIETQPKFRGQWVRCRRDLINGKEAGFWHCTSEGADEINRTPDLRRCERIRWVRAIIEHQDSGVVETWQSLRKGEKRYLLWFNEEFLIVLSERQRKRDGFQYIQLITAYCTEEEHRKRSLRRERDVFRMSQNG
ncbi:MAG: hypothetical protein WCZ89_04020 [Phycisphaerae bacterium]